MLSYAKLWILLQKKGMKKTDLKEVMSSATLAKLSKNETISSNVIEKICKFLDCQPGDIMEYINEENMKIIANELDNMATNAIEVLKEKGITEEQFTSLLQQTVKQMFSNGNVIETAVDRTLEVAKQAKDSEE